MIGHNISMTFHDGMSIYFVYIVKIVYWNSITQLQEKVAVCLTSFAKRIGSFVNFQQVVF
jgi:hypothetical protein